MALDEITKNSEGQPEKESNEVAPHTTQQNAQNNTEQPKDGKKTWFKTLVEGKEWLAIVIAVLAFLAAGYQGYIGRDTEKRELRAYVFVIPNAVTGKLPVVELSAKVDVIGQTPAYQVHEITMRNPVRCREQDAVEPASYASPNNRIISALAPGRMDAMLTDQYTVSQSDARELLLGCALEMNGIIAYVDAFGDQHWTKFCYLWDIASASQNTMDPCLYGNGIDGAENENQDGLPPPLPMESP